MYMAIKSLHMTLAIISILGFVIRGPLAITQHPLMQQKWLRILPHVIDTLLILCALYLAGHLGAHPFNSPWLAAKIIALFIYIILGAKVIKRRGSLTRQWLFYGLAILTFCYIGAVAITKSPWLV